MTLLDTFRAIIAQDEQRLPMAAIDVDAGDIIPSRERRAQISAIASTLMSMTADRRQRTAYAVIAALGDAGFRIVRISAQGNIWRDGGHDNARGQD